VLEVQAANRLAFELINPFDHDQASVPDDADPVGDPLDLRKGVRGQEYRPPVRPNLAHHLLEGLLHQRVQA
jgi:hypothetical protein